MKVTILLTEGLSLFELACAVELFALPRSELSNWYTTQIVSLRTDHYDGLAGSQFHCNKVDQLPSCDLLVIPSYPVALNKVDGHLCQQVLAHFRSGGRIISFCSGAFLLAHIGLLDDRIATTHWRYADEFKGRFPHIRYKDEGLYEYDGVIGCSAGSAAGIDLGIEVIRQDYGYETANSVARRFVLPAHRTGGQTQFVEKPLVKTQSSLSQTLDWAVQNLTAQLTIGDMAKHANMTRRTFDRRFKKHFNMTPLNWLAQQKLDIAKTLLESSDASVEAVAEQSGFDSAVTLRHNFKKYLSISPVDYRMRFRQGET